MDYFKIRTNYIKPIKDIFHLLTITGKYKVIGSSSLESIKYNSDYDLEEIYKSRDKKEILDHIYQLFKDKFLNALKDPNVFITDFKCGLNSDGQPLRWTTDDMMKGYKVLTDGKNASFQGCLLTKSTMKMDIIALINGIFTEFSENYYLKLGNESNFNEEDREKNHLLKSIYQSYAECLNVKRNYLKSLKRIFAYKNILNRPKYKKQLIKLIDFFNSDVGFINKNKNELDLLLILLDNTFKNAKMDDIKHNLIIVKENLKRIDGLDAITKELDGIVRLHSRSLMKTNISKISNELFDIINYISLNFIKNNKSILL